MMNLRRKPPAFGGAQAGSRSGQRTQPDHWSFLFGQIAVYSFVVLLVTGVFLTFFFHPDMTQVRYDGSYTQLRGVKVSKAYDSALHISFDVRGGLLIRQIHHWAALIFAAAVCCQLLRLFLTGAFRRPRLANWLVWVTLLALAMAAGVTGTLLPDDMVSGGSLSLIQGVTQSIPIAGTWLTFLIFGRDIPGHDIIPRAYWLHITLLPLTMAGLLALRHRLVRRHGHTDFPGSRSNAAIGTFQNAPRAASATTFLFTCGALVLLGTFAQITPVWLYGPFEPGAISSGSVPDWYMGFLDGAVRIMPGWEIYIAGHPLTLAVLVPALIVPGVFFTLLAGYPWLERRATGDNRPHHILDRPRDAAARTGICAAGLVFYGLLWAAASNDQIAVTFSISLYALTWLFRIAVLVGPVLAFTVTRTICLALAHKEQEEAKNGRETGRLVMSPTGGYTEIREPAHKPGELVSAADD